MLWARAASPERMSIHRTNMAAEVHFKLLKHLYLFGYTRSPPDMVAWLLVSTVMPIYTEKVRGILEGDFRRHELSWRSQLSAICNKYRATVPMLADATHESYQASCINYNTDITMMRCNCPGFLLSSVHFCPHLFFLVMPKIADLQANLGDYDENGNLRSQETFSAVGYFFRNATQQRSPPFLHLELIHGGTPPVDSVPLARPSPFGISHNITIAPEGGLEEIPEDADEITEGELETLQTQTNSLIDHINDDLVAGFVSLRLPSSSLAATSPGTQATASMSTTDPFQPLEQLSLADTDPDSEALPTVTESRMSSPPPPSIPLVAFVAQLEEVVLANTQASNVATATHRANQEKLDKLTQRQASVSKWAQLALDDQEHDLAEMPETRDLCDTVLAKAQIYQRQLDDMVHEQTRMVNASAGEKSQKISALRISSRLLDAAKHSVSQNGTNERFWDSVMSLPPTRWHKAVQVMDAKDDPGHPGNTWEKGPLAALSCLYTLSVPRQPPSKRRRLGN